MSFFKYVGIDGLYLCLQQNPAILAWRLYFKGKPFGFRNKGVRTFLSDVRRILSLVRMLVQYQRHVPGDSAVIELEVRGNLCQPVHNGYKIFDLRRNVVVKVFSPEIALAAIRSEVERVQSVGKLYNFAPSVRQWNIEERWYEEDYINGYRAKFSDWGIFLKTFRRWLAPMVKNMISASTPQTVNAIEYVCERKNILVGEESKLSDGRLNADKVDTIRAFVDLMIGRLRMTGDRHIHLVFSHGDFSPKHVLITNHGGVVIDWETVGRRSVLFDLYNAFFQQLYLGHEVPGIVAELNNAISSLQSQLTSSAGDIASELLPSSYSAEFHRWIYYIERVCRIVEVHEIDDEMLDIILRWIGAFNRYEEMVANDVIESSQLEQAGWSPTK